MKISNKKFSSFFTGKSLVNFFQKLSDKIGKDIESVSENIFSYTDTKFNINSPKQLSEVLFDQLGLKPVKKRSVAESVGELRQSF